MNGGHLSIVEHKQKSTHTKVGECKWRWCKFSWYISQWTHYMLIEKGDKKNFQRKSHEMHAGSFCTSNITSSNSEITNLSMCRDLIPVVMQWLKHPAHSCSSMYTLVLRLHIRVDWWLHYSNKKPRPGDCSIIHNFPSVQISYVRQLFSVNVLPPPYRTLNWTQKKTYMIQRFVYASVTEGSIEVKEYKE